MSKIAAIVTDMFEDSEYAQPVAAFRGKGHDVITVGLRAGDTIKGKKEGLVVQVERAVDQVSVDDFDALLIPGGYSPDKLRVDAAAVRFTRAFVESGKPVFSICHAPQLLITAEVLEGRRVTGYQSVIQDIKNAGADYEDQPVVIDGNLVSSRHPGDLPQFIDAALEKLDAGSATA